LRRIVEKLLTGKKPAHAVYIGVQDLSWIAEVGIPTQNVNAIKPVPTQGGINNNLFILLKKSVLDWVCKKNNYRDSLIDRIST
jgi:hypothetical protein